MRNSQLNLAELESMHSAICAKSDDDFDQFDELGLGGVYHTGRIKARTAMRECRYGTYLHLDDMSNESRNGFWNVMHYAMVNLAYAMYNGKSPVQNMYRLAYMRGFLNEVRLSLACERLLDAI